MALPRPHPSPTLILSRGNGALAALVFLFLALMLASFIWRRANHSHLEKLENCSFADRKLCKATGTCPKRRLRCFEMVGYTLATSHAWTKMVSSPLLIAKRTSSSLAPTTSIHAMSRKSCTSTPKYWRPLSSAQPRQEALIVQQKILLALPPRLSLR